MSEAYRARAKPREYLAAFGVAALALLMVGCGERPDATVTLSEFTIKPKGVSLRVGQPALFTIVNTGKIEHNLKLDPAVTDRVLPEILKPGERVTVSFTPTKSGTFEYACTIPGHAPAGMTGAITIGA